MHDQLDRRTLLRGIGVTGTAVALAGCSGGGEPSGGSDGSAEDGDGGASGGDDESGSVSIGDEVQSRVEGYVTSDNFEGEIVDATGQDSVTVTVGADGNGGAFAYDPPAIAVSPGTTVVWEWTGEGGQHNVVSDPNSDLEFDSGNPVVESEPFERSFDSAGVGLYFCEPHKSLDMNGAVVVVE